GGDTARVTATSAPAASATVTPQPQELPEPSSSSSRPSLPPGARPVITITDSRPTRPADALERLRRANPQADLSNRKYAARLYPLLVAKSGHAWSLATLARRLSDKKQD